MKGLGTPIVALIPSSPSHRYAPIRVLGFAAAFVGTLSALSPALAGPFDGSWSVLVITRSGPCESYRYGVTISNGIVSSGGAASVSGRVTPNGSVSVSVSSGAQSGHGSGRLSGNRGSGSWRGSGPTGACSGSWSAQRG